MDNSNNKFISKGLDDPPITDLVEGWSFWIHEVAPYIYKVESKSKDGKMLFGYGVSAEDALNDCVRKVKRTTRLKDYLLKIKRLFVKET